MQRVSEIISSDDINTWNQKKIVLINAGTGSGKTTFVKNTLSEYCKKNNKKILLLVNRIALKTQTIIALKKKKNSNTVIKVASYQSIIKYLLKHKPIPQFDYIVADEVHFFFSDSLFNNTTDIAWNWLINNDSIKIIMSATPTIPKEYIKNVINQKIIEYKLETDYNKFIKTIYFYNNSKIIEKILFELPKDERAIFFSGAENAYRMSTLLKDAKFYCSSNNKEKYKKADPLTFNNIVENEFFECQVLCTTSALDNGVNFNDTSLKHIIIDYLDLDELQQMVGRKRILEGEENELILYVKNWNNGTLNRINNLKYQEIEPAEFLKTKGDIELAKKHYKKTQNRIIDTIVNKTDAGEEIHYLVNEMIYTKLKSFISIIEEMMKAKNGYKNGVLKRLQFDKDNTFVLDDLMDAFILTDYLNNLVGDKLFKEQQERLKEFLTCNDKLFSPAKKDHNSLGLNQINGYFRDNNLQYEIKSIVENSRKSDYYKKTYWTICKLSSQIENI